MKKFRSLLMSFFLFSMLASQGFALYSNPDDVPTDCENTECPLMNTLRGNSEDRSENNSKSPAHATSAADIVCPDADEEIVFSGMRAVFMERLQKNNPDRYNEIIERMENRKAKLALLCEKHPFLYAKIMERKAKLLERLEEKYEDITEKLCAEFPHAARCEDRPQGKLPNEEAREEFCKKFPGAADCVKVDDDEDDSDDDDTEDRGGENEDDDSDEDDDNDSENDDDDDLDESNEDEVEGEIQSFTLSSSTAGTITLENGMKIEITNETDIDEEGDITSLNDLVSELDAGETVEVEAEGKYKNESFLAGKIKLEIED